MGQLGDPELEKLIKEHPDAERRLFSVNTTIPPALTKFLMHHNEIFTDEKLDPFNSTSAPYDAFYTAVYAIVALGDEPLTGKGLATGKIAPCEIVASREYDLVGALSGKPR